MIASLFNLPAVLLYSVASLVLLSTRVVGLASSTCNETSTDNHDPECAQETNLAKLVLAPFGSGIIFLVICLLFFGLAVRKGWTDDLAPRIANRPKGVIKTAMKHHISSNSNTNTEQPSSQSNPKCWYSVAWIAWAYNLTHKECLTGIPGTGTRENGREGPLLKTNLDAVILMRFHTFMFKVSVVVAFLCAFVIMPINITAKCDSERFGEGTCNFVREQVNNNLFMKTTIAHIPRKVFIADPNNTENLKFQTSDLMKIFNKKNDDSDNATTTNEGVEGNSINGTNMTSDTSTNTNTATTSSGFGPNSFAANQDLRIWAITISCIIVYCYTFSLLSLEWHANIALRRKYFLEAPHYTERMNELKRHVVQRPNFNPRAGTGEHGDIETTPLKKNGVVTNNNEGVCEKEETDHPSGTTCTNTESYLPPPYLTHPEIRETPPSIGVYSVLYKLPNSMVTYDTDGATTIERQLVATTNFFDEIIPAPGGFSSAVAAVTVLPDAELVAKAWNKWTACEKQLQTLRYIRKRIAVEQQQLHNGIPPNEARASADESNYFTNSETGVFKYEDFNVSKYARSLGFGEEVEAGVCIVDEMGIEEFNVFAYECALLAGEANFHKKLIDIYNLKTLKEKEEEILNIELKKAQDELMEARANVVERSYDHDLAQGKIPSVPILIEKDDMEVIANQEDKYASAAENESLGIRLRRTTTDTPNNRSTRMEISVSSNAEPNKEDSEQSIQNRTMVKSLKHYINRIFRGKDQIEDDGEKYYGTKSEEEKGKGFVTDLNRPSYAVVTFTSRHAAVIARQCLADGTGRRNFWRQVGDIPIYPLADAPQFKFSQRGLMRPVTPNITYTSKKIRLWLTSIFIVIFTVTNVYFVNLINTTVLEVSKFLGESQEVWQAALSSTLSGASQSMLFSISPSIFQLLANSNGQCTSMEKAEQKSIIYFWYFYIIARFMGPILWEAITTFFGGEARTLEDTFWTAIEKLANTVPTTLGPSALTVIIFNSTITWPAFYFLPMQNFVTSLFRLSAINRVCKGGGPGLQVPYRIYVDHGYIFACMIALGPLCPLIGPFALIYFIIIAPMIRWVLVFEYRPIFDGGGDKWPKLHEIIVTSVLLGQFMTSIVFFLKYNIVQGLVIFFCIVPTLLYNTVILEKFLRPYQDASLLQTGRLYSKLSRRYSDIWQEREEYRRWLVDCHKSSYLPTCLSGGKMSLLTAEPAVVIRDSVVKDNSKNSEKLRVLLVRQQAQKGGILRRQQYNI